MRTSCRISTICYLIKNGKILFTKLYDQENLKYNPPGNKIKVKDTPIECIVETFKKKTGLKLINPKFKGIVHWTSKDQGIIFIFTSNEYSGILIDNSYEDSLEWVEISDIKNLIQPEINKSFFKYVLKEGLFEGKYLLDEDYKVIDYKITRM